MCVCLSVFWGFETPPRGNCVNSAALCHKDKANYSVKYNYKGRGDYCFGCCDRFVSQRFPPFGGRELLIKKIVVKWLFMIRKSLLMRHGNGLTEGIEHKTGALCANPPQ